MRILIATNHSYMFYRFRKELVEALMQEHEAGHSQHAFRWPRGRFAGYGTSLHRYRD